MRLLAVVGTRKVCGRESLKISMTKVIVYSCVTASYDDLDRTLFRSTHKTSSDISFVLFSDCVSPGFRGIWQIEPLKWQHPLCVRRTARYHKCLSHHVLPSHDCSVWIDGSQIVKVDDIVTELVSPIIADGHDLATFKHPIRQCVYQEERACERYRKDSKDVMRRQIERYRAEGYPAYNGMVETACVVRANTPEVCKFNETWWGELEKDSFRDQLSFNYTCWSLGKSYGHIPGHRESSPFFEFVSHKR